MTVDFYRFVFNVNRLYKLVKIWEGEECGKIIFGENHLW